jgi:rod shape-determining protein MreB
MIGERTAEEIKIDLGAAYFSNGEGDMARKERIYHVRGRDLVTGLPRTIEVKATEIHEALSEPVNAIMEAIKSCLERTPPELAADLMDRGIVLAGGGSLLWGLDRLVSQETGMPVNMSEDPLTAVAVGTGKMLENIEVLKRLQTHRYS